MRSKVKHSLQGDNRVPSLFPPPQICSSFSSTASIVLAQADSLSFLKHLPDEKVQLVITSPPYNIGKEYEEREALDSYLEYQSLVAEQLVRILRPEGSICWEVGNFVLSGEVVPLDVLFYEVFKKKGLKLRNRIIWRFNHGLHASKRFSGRYETILWFTKSEKYVFNLDSVRVPSKYPGKRHFKGPRRGLPSGNPLGKNPSDVWEFVAKDWDEELWDIPNVKANHPEKTIHPCQYPVELVERCVLALTNEDDWVLDPFCGVGSGMIGALRHRRRAIGVDRDGSYVEAARNRIVAFFEGKLRIRAIGKPIYEPSGNEKVAQVPEEWKAKNTEHA